MNYSHDQNLDPTFNLGGIEYSRKIRFKGHLIAEILRCRLPTSTWFQIQICRHFMSGVGLYFGPSFTFFFTIKIMTRLSFDNHLHTSRSKKKLPLPPIKVKRSTHFWPFGLYLVTRMARKLKVELADLQIALQPERKILGP